MDFLSNSDDNLATEDTYDITFGRKIQRLGKIFSYTFWRTEIHGEIFWSVQGNSKRNGTAWICTKYFGRPEEAKRYQQEIILHHPFEKQIKMYYMSTCVEGMNCINISRQIIEHFKDENNAFRFEFRLLKVKRRPYPKRMLFDDPEAESWRRICDGFEISSSAVFFLNEWMNNLWVKNKENKRFFCNKIYNHILIIISLSQLYPKITQDSPILFFE